MSRAKKISDSIKHSKEFLSILLQEDVETAIRTITHSSPILVFWVNSEGAVIDAGEAHHNNPPNGDRSVLSDKMNKGYLRGRAAKIGDKVYIVIYGDQDKNLSNRQLALLKRSYLRILSTILEKGISQNLVDSAIFINEIGDAIEF